LLYVFGKAGVGSVLSCNEPRQSFLECDDDCDAGYGHPLFGTCFDGAAVKGRSADEPFIGRIPDNYFVDLLPFDRLAAVYG